MSLQDQAMLVDLSISRPGATKEDKSRTAEYCQDKGVSGRHARVRKDLFPDGLLKDVNNAASRIYRYHERMTLPWKGSSRILPGLLFPDFTDGLRKLIDGFDRAVTDARSKYQASVKAAKLDLGPLYNEADYMTDAEFGSKFGVFVEYSPVPRNDWRLDLTEDELESLRVQLDTFHTFWSHEARRLLGSNLSRVVSLLAAKLQDPEAIFRDSLVGNVASELELCRKLNIEKDVVLEEACLSVEELLVGCDLKSLREDKFMRAAAAGKARSVVDKIKEVCG